MAVGIKLLPVLLGTKTEVDLKPVTMLAQDAEDDDAVRREVLKWSIAIVEDCQLYALCLMEFRIVNSTARRSRADGNPNSPASFER